MSGDVTKNSEMKRGRTRTLKKPAAREHERKMWDSKLRTSRGHVTPSRHPFSCREKIMCPGKITDIGHVPGHVQDMSRTCETKPKDLRLWRAGLKLLRVSLSNLLFHICIGCINRSCNHGASWAS